MVRQLSRCTEKLAGKAVETLPAIVQSAAGAILSFLGKAVGFVAEHTWTLIVFAVGLVGWWMMQKIKKSYTQLAHMNEVGISLFMISLRS